MDGRSGRPRTSRRPPAAAILCLALLAAGAAGCGDEVEPETPGGATEPATATDLELAPPVEPSGEEGDTGEADLPGNIPPAAGEADAPGAAASPGAGPGGTADVGREGERPGVTAFAGATSRGRYLAEQVAMCVQCHSPKDESGRVLEERKFQGSAIPAESPYPAQDWAVEAPALAGMAFYSRDEAVRLLTEGITRDGDPPKPPMPPFRMTPEDAGAIYDYLAGLPRAPSP